MILTKKLVSIFSRAPFSKDSSFRDSPVRPAISAWGKIKAKVEASEVGDLSE